MRSGLGDIDFSSGADGGFKAIWRNVTADVVINIHRGLEGDGSIALEIAGSLYQQRISASGEGKKYFSQNEDGRRVTAKLIKLWNWVQLRLLVFR